MSMQRTTANNARAHQSHRATKVAWMVGSAVAIVGLLGGGGYFAVTSLLSSSGDTQQTSASTNVRSTPTSGAKAAETASPQNSDAPQNAESKPDDHDPFVKSMDWLKTATAEEKDSLRRKRERFERLPETEKDHLRQFHQTLMSHPDRERLQQVLIRYDEWLRTLTPAKRAEIQDLPVDQRIAKIKEFQEEQARRALGFFGETKLPDQDIPRLYEWIDSFVAANEEMLLEKLPEHRAEWIRRRARSDDWRRRRIAYELTTLELDELRDMVTVQDVETLLSQLSSEAHEILKTRTTSEDKAILVQRWIRFALMARNMYMMPKVSDEDLEKFFREELTEEEQEQLDRMPPDQRKQRLEWLYRSRHSRRGASRDDGPGSNARIEYDLIDRWILLADQSQSVQFIDAFRAYNPDASHPEPSTGAPSQQQPTESLTLPQGIAVDESGADGTSDRGEDDGEKDDLRDADAKGLSSPAAGWSELSGAGQANDAKDQDKDCRTCDKAKANDDQQCRDSARDPKSLSEPKTQSDRQTQRDRQTQPTRDSHPVATESLGLQ